MRKWKFLLTAGATCLVLGLLGVVPPLGPFLDPFHGLWQNAEATDILASRVVKLKGLTAPVTVLFDKRGVPHIFAENDRDLFFAQGYITANDRLWQMDFSTHSAAGRLAEIVGKKAIGFDRYQRRIGIVTGARASLEEMKKDSEFFGQMSAYSAGINACIDQLSPTAYPVEYKILDYEPEPWTPLKSSLLIKYMALVLAGESSDFQMSNTLAKFGEEEIADLFPAYPDPADPVIPEDRVWNFQPEPVTRPHRPFRRGAFLNLSAPKPDTVAVSGSNNWAVSGTKTASGYPLLANDPHLDLSLPAIWYEIQLVSPTVNVYGVSLPGVPGVIIGFNRAIAWGLTNAGTDVMDWYELKFRDGSLREYWYDNAWHRTIQRIEEIKVRGGETVLDTIYSTKHHGPILADSSFQPADRQVPPFHALRWIAHDPSNEIITFYKLNRAQNFEAFVNALTPFACPAQNFLYADVHGNIALWHSGKFPVRWEGQGTFIGDGSDPLHTWQAWVPKEHLPFVKNPEQGFISSANQNPTASSYPYHPAGDYASPYRGRRINERLSEMEGIVPDDFRMLQLDTKNLIAESVLPGLLAQIDTSALGSEGKKMFQTLSNWNFFSDADRMAPTIFDVFWKRLFSAIWDDEFGAPEANLRYPSTHRTVKMILKEPSAHWFDNVHTDDSLETLDLLVNHAFKTACEHLLQNLGPIGEAWKWGNFKGVDILHLAKIPGLGREGLFAGGGWGIVNAIQRKHGPSWRMVVELGPEVKGWGIYPGGQSGNSGSPHYDDFIEPWEQGELAELLLLETVNEAHPSIVSRYILQAP